jgi:hypothetical protein
MIARMWSKRSSHSLLMRTQNDTATLSESLSIFTKLIVHGIQQLYYLVFIQINIFE